MGRFEKGNSEHQACAEGQMMGLQILMLNCEKNSKAWKLVFERCAILEILSVSRLEPLPINAMRFKASTKNTKKNWT
jgi:hypothetical protein